MLVSLQDIPKTPGKFLSFPKKLQDFLGFLPSHGQWSISLYGEPGCGKSSFAFKLADVLTSHGKVLYTTSEEDPKAGAMGLRAATMKVMGGSKIDILETNSPTVMWDQLSTKAYRFCIIDSINEFLDENENVIPAKTITQKRKNFPYVNFVFISKTRSDGKQAGGKNAAFRADLVIFCSHETKDKNSACIAKLEKYRYGSTSYQYMIHPAKKGNFS
jgi:predicted ATP-dependent serine protease